TNVNDAPTVTSTANIVATEDSPYTYTFTASDVDAGDTLILSAVTLPSWLSFDPGSGVLSGTPTNAEVGDHSVVLRVNDGTVDVDQSFTITVTNVNDAPTSITLDNHSVVELSVGAIVGNLDSVDDDSGDTHTYTVDDARFEVVAGELKLQSGQSLDRAIELTVNVTVISTDAGGLSASQMFTITVTELNLPPTAVDDNLSTIEDTTLTITTMTDLLANDSDPNGDSLTLSTFTQPLHGVLVDNGDGTFTYTPEHNFMGTDSINYTLSDGQGGTASGTAFIVVAPVGDTPRVTDVSTLDDTQSGLITIRRHVADGAEVTHFRISGISDGTLFLADGTTELNNGDFISVAQGQAGLRFTPAAGATEGHFQIESSEDGITVASQSGQVTATITVVASSPITVPEIPTLEPDELPTPVETVEEVVEVAEEIVEEITDSLEQDSEQAVETNNLINAGVAADIVENQTSAGVGNSFNTFSRRWGPLENNKDGLIANDLSSVQSLLLQLETTTLETLKNAWDALYVKPLTMEDYDLVRRSFDAIRDEMNADGKFENAVVSSAIITSMGLSAGYVFWMLKGGSLLASVLSSMPAWYLADPLSILSGMKQDDEDDESLENIIDQGAEPATEEEDDEQGDPR
ncbi:MAG: tandem-95 repeat protein, partial [Desulfuromusa sp.]|nr:tandem-95 repeat protein [Desulfuromusa sp.]